MGKIVPDPDNLPPRATFTSLPSGYQPNLVPNPMAPTPADLKAAAEAHLARGGPLPTVTTSSGTYVAKTVAFAGDPKYDEPDKDKVIGTMPSYSGTFTSRVDPTRFAPRMDSGYELQFYQKFAAYLLEMLGGSIVLSEQELLAIMDANPVIEMMDNPDRRTVTYKLWEDKRGESDVRDGDAG